MTLDSRPNVQAANRCRAARSSQAEATTPDADPRWPIAESEERSVLASAICGRAQAVVKIFSADGFGLSSHREIFLAISALVEAGEVARGEWLEYSAIESELRRRGTLEQVGGVAFVYSLTDGCVPGRSLQRRWRVLDEFHGRRVGLKFAAELERRLLDPTVSFAETLHWVKSQVD